MTHPQSHHLPKPARPEHVQAHVFCKRNVTTEEATAWLNSLIGQPVGEERPGYVVVSFTNIDFANEQGIGSAVIPSHFDVLAVAELKYVGE